MKNYNLEGQIADLTVIKDSLLFKVLVKLVAKQEEAIRNEKDIFSYSLNEFRLDLQIGKATLVRKFKRLEELGYLEVVKNISVPEGRKKSCYLKTDYRVNLNAVNDLINDLAPLSQIERVEYVNNMLQVITSKSLYSIKEISQAKEEPMKLKKVDKPKISEEKQEVVGMQPPAKIKNEIYADFIKQFPLGTFKKNADCLLEDIFNRKEPQETVEYLVCKDGWDKLYKLIKDTELYSNVKDFAFDNYKIAEYLDKFEKMKMVS